MQAPLSTGGSRPQLTKSRELGRAFRRNRLELALRVVLGGTLSMLVGGFFVFVSAVEDADRAALPQAEGIVAFSGDPERIYRSFDLLSRGAAYRLLITGLDNGTEIAQLLASHPWLAACCVEVNSAAENTAGDAIATQHWVRKHSIRSLIVVTSNFHMPRALVELDRLLPEVRKASAGVPTGLIDTSKWWESSAAVKLLVREYAKLIGAWIRIQIEGAPPPG